MTDNRHTETVELTADDPKTHALLRALAEAQQAFEQRAELNDSDYWAEYAIYIEEWREAASDAYYHDRREADPTIETEADD